MADKLWEQSRVICDFSQGTSSTQTVHQCPKLLRQCNLQRQEGDMGRWSWEAGQGHIGHVGQATYRPTGYTAGLSSCLCAGWRRLRDCWAKVLDSSRDGSGSFSCRRGGREGRDAGWLRVRAQPKLSTGEGKSPVPVAGRVAVMAPPGLASQCRAPGPPEARPSVPAQPWVGALLPTVVDPVAKTLCKRQGTCHRGTGDLKKDKGERGGNHHQGL